MAKMSGSEHLLTLEAPCHISGSRIQSQGEVSGWIISFFPSSPVCPFGTASQRFCKRTFNLRWTTEMSDYIATSWWKIVFFLTTCRNSFKPSNLLLWFKPSQQPLIQPLTHSLTPPPAGLGENQKRKNWRTWGLRWRNVNRESKSHARKQSTTRN